MFEARQRSDLRLDGMCSLDEIVFADHGFKGMTFRLYNPERDEWTIWWITDRDGVMQPPVMGRFDGTRGTFRGEDMDGDRPVQVVFDWQTAEPNAPRWSQAFSYDGGKSWETNWIMEFRRP
uniref:DUF1579 domain-containing protein n=1 Tax=Phenylobacterium glaciei TaxID=2803784 RepID=A0A974SBC8_9CAUL|nr:hypothetical protein JKL49_12150 [Phenylobacterium glaciei]